MLSIRKARGRLFQIRGPTAPKLLSPKLLCVCGTAHMLSEEDRRAWTMSQLLLYDLHRLDVSRALGGGGCDCSPEPSVNVPRWSLCSRLRPHLWSATLHYWLYHAFVAAPWHSMPLLLLATQFGLHDYSRRPRMSQTWLENTFCLVFTHCRWRSRGVSRICATYKREIFTCLSLFQWFRPSVTYIKHIKQAYTNCKQESNASYHTTILPCVLCIESCVLIVFYMHKLFMFMLVCTKHKLKDRHYRKSKAAKNFCAGKK